MYCVHCTSHILSFTRNVKLDDNLFSPLLPLCVLCVICMVSRLSQGDKCHLPGKPGKVRNLTLVRVNSGKLGKVRGSMVCL